MMSYKKQIQSLNREFSIDQCIQKVDVGQLETDVHPTLIQLDYWREEKKWEIGTVYFMSVHENKSYRFKKSKYEGYQEFYPDGEIIRVDRFNPSGVKTDTYEVDPTQRFMIVKASNPSHKTCKGSEPSENAFIEKHRKKFEMFLFGYCDKGERITFYLFSKYFLK